MRVCVFVFVCLTKLKRRGNLSSVFSLLILVCVRVLVCVLKSARVLVFFCIFCIQRFNVVDLKELFKSLNRRRLNKVKRLICRPQGL